MGLCNASLTCRDSETLLLCGIVGKYCDNMTMVIMLKEIDHINPKYSYVAHQAKTYKSINIELFFR